MSSLYRRSIKKLISHLTIGGKLELGPSGERKAKRGRLFEFLEMRQLFSGTPTDISTNVFGTETFSSTLFSTNFTGGTLADIEITTLPANGTLLFQGAAVTANTSIPVGQLSQLTYTPNAGFTGTDAPQWDGSDGSGFSGTPANLTLNVQTDHAPTVSDLTIAADKNDAQTITASNFLGQFTDPDTGDTLQAVKIVSLPANGTLMLGGANGTAVTAGQTIQLSSFPLTYVPNPNITGTDTFQWKGSDGAQFSGNATVTMNVTNSAPTLSNVSIGVPTKNPTGLTASNFTLGFHDTNNNDTIQSLTVLSLPTHGNLTIGGANGTLVTANQTLTPVQLGTLNYTPDPNYTGSDSFTWNASDGVAFAAAPATATIVRAGVNFSTPYSIPEGITSNLDVQSLKDAYSDIANGSLQSITFLTTPSNGTLFVNNVALTAGTLGTPFSVSGLTLSFTPNNPANSSAAVVDTFEWEGTSGNLTSDIGDILILAFAPKVTDISFTGLENSVLTIPTAQIAGDFSNASQGNPAVFEVTTLPSHGTLMIDGAPAVANTTYSVSDLTIAYTPNTGYTGSDTFGFTESINGTLFPANPANISLTVIGPTVSNATASIGENQLHLFPKSDFAFTSDLTDAGFSPTTFEITLPPAHGTLTINDSVVPKSIQSPLTFDYSTLKISYRPDPGFTGTDSFSWSLSADGTTFAPTALETLTVSAPTVTGFSIFAGAGAPFVFTTQFATNFHGVDDALRIVRITKLPAHGVLKLGGAAVTVGQNIPVANVGLLRYTAAAGFTGSDTFSWTGGDGVAVAVPAAAVTVSVLPPLSVFGNGFLIAQNKAPTVTNFTDFGSWTLAPNASMQPDTRTFTIRNSSNSNMIFTGVTLGGTDKNDFRVAPAGRFTLAPGESKAIQIRFVPQGGGIRSAAVILRNAAGAIVFQFAIQGTAFVTSAISTKAGGAGGVVQVATTKTGNGQAATNGMILSIKYTGYLAKTGVIFDSSAAHANTATKGLTFRLDDDYADSQPFLSKDVANIQTSNTTTTLSGIDFPVIAGWEFGLQGIRPGEKRLFIINSAAGYGEGGSGATIPPGATLIFEVECVQVNPKPQVEVLSRDSFGQFSITPASTSSSQTSTFVLFNIAQDDANGTPLASWKFTGRQVDLNGHHQADFTVSAPVQDSQFPSAADVTVTFHPLTPGVKDEILNIYTTDPITPTQNIQMVGNSTPFADLAAGFDPTLNLPTVTEFTGSGQSMQVPVTVSNSGDATFPGHSHTNIQIYARLVDPTNPTSGGNLTLVGFVNNIDVSNLEVRGIKRFYPQISLPLGMAAGTYAFEAVVNQSNVTSNASVSALVTVPTPWVTMVQGGGNGANQTMTDNDTVDTTTFPIVSQKVHNRLINVVAGRYILSGNLGSSTITGTTTGAHGAIVVNVQNLGNIFTNPNQVFSVDIVASEVDTGNSVLLVPGYPVPAGHVGVNGTISLTIPVDYTGALRRTGYFVIARVRLVDQGHNLLSSTQIISLDNNLSPVLFHVS